MVLKNCIDHQLLIDQPLHILGLKGLLYRLEGRERGKYEEVWMVFERTMNIKRIYSERTQSLSIISNSTGANS